MTTNTLKKQLINRIAELPKNHLQEVVYFVEFLKMHEEQWFIDHVNKKTQQAIADKLRRKKFHTLTELQREYGNKK